MAEILKKMDERPMKMRERDIAISLYGLQSHEEPNRYQFATAFSMFSLIFLNTFINPECIRYVVRNIKQY